MNYGNSIYRKSILVFVFLVIGIFSGNINALPPAGYSEFYIPGGEQQMWDIFYAMDPYNMTQANGIHAIISIAASTDNTKVYYDHWEDGYDFDPLDPSSADVTYTLNKGDVQRCESSNIPIPRGTGTYFDGQDRIYTAGGPVTITRGSWPESTSTRDSILWEILPTTPFLTSYTIPVGENLSLTPLNYDDFNRTFVLVQSLADGNYIEIDDPSTAGIDVTVTLDRGEVEDLYNIDSGTTVTADFPVQVQIMAGYYSSSAHWMTRGFTCIPSTLWDDEYYCSVPTFYSDPVAETDLYIFNPMSTSLTINYEDLLGSGSFSIGPYGTLSYSDGAGRFVPLNSGVHLFADQEFWAVGSSDIESTLWEWGFALIPADLLTDEYQMAWAPGSTNVPPTENGSPVFVTPIEDYTVIYVDYAPNDGVTDATYTVNRLEVLRLLDPALPTPGNDNTGMNIWATGPIAVTWGQEAGRAGSGNPYLDLGYSSISVNPEYNNSVLQIQKEADPQIFQPGTSQTVTFTLNITTFGYAVESVDVEDFLPADWSYVTGSTIVTYPDGSSSAFTPSLLGQTLTWDLNQDMNADETMTIVYQATASNPVAGTHYRNVAQAIGTITVNSLPQTFTARDQSFHQVTGLNVSKTSSAAGVVNPGQRITYTISVTNNGPVLVEDISVRDPLPDYTTYVPGSSQVTSYTFGSTNNFADLFNNQNYTSNNGSLNWTGGWNEIGETTSATGGNIRVVRDGTLRPNYQLRIRNNDATARGIYRTANLSGSYTATLSFLYRRASNMESGDFVALNISTDGGTTYTQIDRFFGDGTGDATYQTATYDITPYISSTTRIQFMGDTAGDTDEFWVDNVDITVNRTRQTFNTAAHDPPGLVTSLDGYDLYPGESMVVTFQVDVDDPLPQGVHEIINIVYVTNAAQKGREITAETYDVPTLATISAVEGYIENGNAIVIWSTSSEHDTVAFQLQRLNPETNNYETIHDSYLPALLDAPQGGVYRLIDPTAKPGQTCSYQLLEVESRGTRKYGPYTVTFDKKSIPEKLKSGLNPMKYSYQKQSHPSNVIKRVTESRDLIADVNSYSDVINPPDVLNIVVKDTGIYYISALEIAQKLRKPEGQIQKAIRAGNLELKNQGVPIACLPDSNGDAIVFYGQQSESIYSDVNVYQLFLNRGMIMDVVSGNEPDTNTELLSFEDHLHMESNEYALTAVFEDPESDYWAWDSVYAGYYEMSAQFNPGSIPSSGTATLKTRLIGATDTSFNPDHHAQIKVNGVIVGEGLWDGLNVLEVNCDFDQSLIHQGINDISVAGLTDTGVPYSFFYIDFFELTYERYYTTDSDMFVFSTGQHDSITISGFSSSDIFVVDISDPSRPIINNNSLVFQDGNTWSISFKSLALNSKCIALTASSMKTPVELKPATSGKLLQTKNKAEYLIISPDSLLSGAGYLASYRISTGYLTKVIRLEDIYTDFNFGNANPWAIKDFLTYAFNSWQNPPQYVVLLGNGTYDYKNYKSYSDNLLPPVMVSTPYGLFASDNCLADVSGNDGIPELAIGRIPVLTNAEIDYFLEKLTRYSASSGSNRVIFAADDPDAGGDFPTDSNLMAALVPDTFEKMNIHLTEYSASEAKSMFLTGLNTGAAFVNYIGHGGLDRYAEEGIFESDDCLLLTNSDVLPVVANLTCTTGRFEIPGFDSINECLVLHPFSGSIAVFSPTGLSIDQYAMALGSDFVDEMFNKNKNIGHAITAAKSSYTHFGYPPFILDMYNLLGDPLIQIR